MVPPAKERLPKVLFIKKMKLMPTRLPSFWEAALTSEANLLRNVLEQRSDEDLKGHVVCLLSNGQMFRSYALSFIDVTESGKALDCL